MRRLLLTLALGATLCSIAAAQTADPTKPPDLSGTWELNLAKSKLDKHNKIKSQTITITTSGDTIQFHYATHPKDLLYTYVADGKERPLGIWTENEDSSVKATWENSVLVIDQAVGPPGQLRIHSIDRWSLAADGKTLLLTSHLNAKLSFVYDKQ
jgi:hypothetical protein